MCDQGCPAKKQNSCPPKNDCNNNDNLSCAEKAAKIIAECQSGCKSEPPKEAACGCEAPPKEAACGCDAPPKEAACGCDAPPKEQACAPKKECPTIKMLDYSDCEDAKPANELCGAPGSFNDNNCEPKPLYFDAKDEKGGCGPKCSGGM